MLLEIRQERVFVGDLLPRRRLRYPGWWYTGVMPISAEEQRQRTLFGSQFIQMVDGVKRGDSVAEQELLGHLYGSRLLRQQLAGRLCAILPTYLDLEDTVLLVFEKVLAAARAGNAPTDPTKVMAWLRRVFSNAALDVRKMPRHNVETTTIEDELTRPEEAGLTDSSEALDPLDAVQSKQVHLSYQNCVSHLPERQQGVWLMYFGDTEYKYKEIAESLGMETSTVGATVHAARKNLRTCMESAGHSFGEDSAHAN